MIANKIIGKKVSTVNLLHSPFRGEVENFITKVNDKIEKENLSIPKIHSKNIFFQWEGDKYYMFLSPYLKDRLEDPKMEKLFNEDMVGTFWMKDGEDPIFINSQGLFSKKLTIPEITFVKKNIIPWNEIYKNNLYSLFGYNKKEWIKLKHQF